MIKLYQLPFFCCLLSLSIACTKNTDAVNLETIEQTTLVEIAPIPQEEVTSPEIIVEISPTWLPLRERLKNDGFDDQALDLYFSKLGEIPSEKPMGTKIKELYTNSFVKKTPSKTSTPSTNYDYPPKTSKIPGPWYKNIVTKQNAQLCIDFINTYSDAFNSAYETYNVPPDLAAALLFIETRLGSYTGVDNAFVTLASMATTTDISQIPTYIEKLPQDPYAKQDWINQKMSERSEWAYKELKAYVEHILNNNLDPFSMPSSVYGAIGLCQFMPSNLKPYAKDGDNDNIIDLFNPPDAIHSLSNYLKKYGWKEDATLSQKQTTLKKYNNLTTYANTILALAEKIRELQES